ncbi:cytosolic protein [Candidatus Woesearchaeota archaeon]|nr:cytosolic protein [Candidatus Woesearchaeota archaeon]
MQCQNKQKNLENCNCTYGSCDKKGVCCECMRFHLRNNELPACFFPDDAEKTFDRSIKKFIEINKN